MSKSHDLLDRVLFFYIIKCAQNGEDYGLFYWDNQWISLGVQRAKKQYLKYTVPENALLWLRNMTRGKEERIFSYENGKKVWW